MRRPFGARRRVEPVISSKNVDTIRVPGFCSPPMHIGNPPVTRKVRYSVAVGATAGSTTISAQFLADLDAKEYLGAATSTANRFTSYRLLKVEAWLAPTTAGSGGTTTLTVRDTYSGTDFTDTVNPGVDYAHVAVRTCLYGRIVWLGATNTNSIASIETGASTGFAGQLTADLTFEAS